MRSKRTRTSLPFLFPLFLSQVREGRGDATNVPLITVILCIYEFLMSRRDTLDLLLERTPQGTALSSTDIAHMFGFTDVEIKMMKVYMQEDFNASHIYLSDYIISKYLTRERTVDRYKHFYTQILKKHYIEGEDFFEVEFEHPAVQIASELLGNEEELSRLNLAAGPMRRINGKKYYLVTGRCYKKLLMKANTDEGNTHCDYYLKLEEVASVALQYFAEVELQRRIKSQEDEIRAKEEMLCSIREEERAKAAAEAKVMRARQQEVFARFPMKNTAGYVYVLRSPNPALSPLIKIGKSIEPKGRLSTLKTGAPGGLQLIKAWFVDNAYATEHAIHEWFQETRVKKTNEPHSTSAASGWFICYDGMIEEMEDIITMRHAHEQKHGTTQTSLVHDLLLTRRDFTIPDLDSEELDNKERPRSLSRGRDTTPHPPAPAPAAGPKKRSCYFPQMEGITPDEKKYLMGFLASYKEANNVDKFPSGACKSLLDTELAAFRGRAAAPINYNIYNILPSP